MTKPNFFIVGAPKCATTALTEYLRRHPEVGIIPKEAHFFGSDLEFRRRLPTRQGYLAMAGELDHLPAVGDASVYYLYSRTAAAEIKAFCPEARIIIMLRNPVDVMYSLHGQLLINVDEDIQDFEQALAAEPDRAAGRRIPRSVHAVHALHYRAIVSFAEQVSRYLRMFGAPNVLVWTYDDVVRDTPGMFRSSLEFLGVDPNFSTTFEPVNEARRLRFKALRMIQKNVPLQTWKWLPRTVRRQGSKVYHTLTYADARRPPMPAALRAQLLEEFRPEIDRLAAVIGRDLSHWYQTSPEVAPAAGAQPASLGTA